MVKSYFFIILFFVSLCFFAQEAENKYASPISDDGFDFYPNPVTNGKIYVTLRKNREIEIFNILGSVVLRTKPHEKELNVSNLVPGVYIIKVKGDKGIVARKLIIK